ncbi:MAG: anti-sigma factor family protein [Candidatus Binatia bacterium]
MLVRSGLSAKGKEMNMQCQELRKLMDSYLCDELLVETNHDVLRHLENCAVCRSELAARGEFRTKVGMAVKTSDEFKINPRFSSRMTADLRSKALRPTFLERVVVGRNLLSSRSVAVAFVFLLFIAFGTAILIRNFTERNSEKIAANPQPNSRPVDQPSDRSIVEAIRASWNELAHEAVGDHKNCALEFHLLEKPISLDEAAKKYGAFNKDIDKTVIAAIDDSTAKQMFDGAKLLDAHSCVFAGRRFTHIVLKAKGTVVSVLISDSDIQGTGDEINSNQFDDMSVAGFRTDRHVVFVVSQLSGADNILFARTIAPAIRTHIENSNI